MFIYCNNGYITDIKTRIVNTNQDIIAQNNLSTELANVDFFALLLLFLFFLLLFLLFILLRLLLLLHLLLLLL